MTPETGPTTAPALLPLLRDRRSIRTYDESHVLADGELCVLLEAARWAPSAGNSQPWAFLVGRRGDSAHRRFVELLSRGNSTWAPRASALLFSLHQVASGPDELVRERDQRPRTRKPLADLAFAGDFGTALDL